MPRRNWHTFSVLTSQSVEHVTPWGHPLGHLLVRALAVSLLGDAVEKLRELHEAIATPDGSLSLLETSLFHFAHELNLRSKYRVFGYLRWSEL